jgi:hypothetical protein
MASLITTDDLSVWLDGTVDEDRAEAVIAAVSSLIRSESGLTWEDTAVPADIAAVAAQVALRVYRNPTGVASETIDGYSARYTDGALAGLYLTPGELRIVRRYRANQRGLWTLGTTRGDTLGDTVYVPVEGTTTKFPWYAGDVEV